MNKAIHIIEVELARTEYMDTLLPFEEIQSSCSPNKIEQVLIYLRGVINNTLELNKKPYRIRIRLVDDSEYLPGYRAEIRQNITVDHETEQKRSE